MSAECKPTVRSYTDAKNTFVATCAVVASASLAGIGAGNIGEAIQAGVTHNSGGILQLVDEAVYNFGTDDAINGRSAHELLPLILNLEDAPVDDPLRIEITGLQTDFSRIESTTNEMQSDGEEVWFATGLLVLSLLAASRINRSLDYSNSVNPTVDLARFASCMAIAAGLSVVAVPAFDRVNPFHPAESFTHNTVQLTGDGLKAAGIPSVIGFGGPDREEVEEYAVSKLAATLPEDYAVVVTEERIADFIKTWPDLDK